MISFEYRESVSKLDKKKEGLLGFILLLVGIAVTFINLVLGLVITVFSFIISLSSMSKKGALIKVTLVLSILAMCVQTFMLVVAYKTVDDVHKNADDKVSNIFNAQNEKRFRTSAESYFFKEVLTNKDLDDTGELTVTMDEIGSQISGCDGYAIYDIKTRETKVYIECGEYRTPGFNDSKMK